MPFLTDKEYELMRRIEEVGCLVSTDERQNNLARRLAQHSCVCLGY